MPQYLFQCASCGFQVEVMRPIDSRNDPPVSAESEGCCASTTWERPLTAPGVMEHSYVDGQRKNEKGWRDMREAVKLERKMYDMPNKDRGKIQREINKLKGGK